jgi:hypothetical protein
LFVLKNNKKNLTQSKGKVQRISVEANPAEKRSAFGPPAEQEWEQYQVGENVR